MKMRKKYVGFVNDLLMDVPCSQNLSYSWSFGSLLGVFFVHQVVSGVLLAFHYVPEVGVAFENMFYIQRDISTGWFLRLIHANGASFLMLFCYLHMARGIFFSSYVRVSYVWFSGLCLLILMMAAAFLGYVLPWGQMSFWGATVITNLFSVVPWVGGQLVEALWGGYTVGGATLNRFFVIHFLVPLVMVPLVMGHMLLLHDTGSSNPLGSSSGSNVPFHPYMTSMDLLNFVGWVTVFGGVVFLFPHLLGCPDNFEKANPLKTPIHIQPEWYFLPFYAILRSIPHKAGGVVTMAMSIAVFFFLSLVTTTRVSAGLGHSVTREVLFFMFVVNLVALGWIGACPLEIPFLSLGLCHTYFYFAYFVGDLILRF